MGFPSSPGPPLGRPLAELRLVFGQLWVQKTWVWIQEVLAIVVILLLTSESFSWHVSELSVWLSSQPWPPPAAPNLLSAPSSSSSTLQPLSGVFFSSCSIIDHLLCSSQQNPWQPLHRTKTPASSYPNSALSSAGHTLFFLRFSSPSASIALLIPPPDFCRDLWPLCVLGWTREPDPQKRSGWQGNKVPIPRPSQTEIFGFILKMWLTYDTFQEEFSSLSPNRSDLGNLVYQQQSRNYEKIKFSGKLSCCWKHKKNTKFPTIHLWELLPLCFFFYKHLDYGQSLLLREQGWGGRCDRQKDSKYNSLQAPFCFGECYLVCVSHQES